VTHLDFGNSFIALFYAVAVGASAIKTRKTKSRGGVSWFTILSALVFNIWFIYFYWRTGFPIVAASEVVCVAAYIWWLVEYLRASDA
jgi:hypothetical protein